MNAPGFEYPHDFPGRLLGVEDMLKDILRDKDVKSVAGEGELLEIFTPHPIFFCPPVGVREELTLRVKRAMTPDQVI